MGPALGAGGGVPFLPGPRPLGVQHPHCSCSSLGWALPLLTREQWFLAVSVH